MIYAAKVFFVVFLTVNSLNAQMSNDLGKGVVPGKDIACVQLHTNYSDKGDFILSAQLQFYGAYREIWNTDKYSARLRFLVLDGGILAEPDELIGYEIRVEPVKFVGKYFENTSDFQLGVSLFNYTRAKPEYSKLTLDVVEVVSADAKAAFDIGSDDFTIVCNAKAGLFNKRFYDVSGYTDVKDGRADYSSLAGEFGTSLAALFKDRFMAKGFINLSSYYSEDLNVFADMLDEEHLHVSSRQSDMGFELVWTTKKSYGDLDACFVFGKRGNIVEYEEYTPDLLGHIYIKKKEVFMRNDYLYGGLKFTFRLNMYELWYLIKNNNFEGYECGFKKR